MSFIAKVNHEIYIKKLPENISWRYFCEKSTIGGLKYIFRRRPLVLHLRLIWIAILLTMLGLTILLCTRSTIKYLEYRIKTRMYYQKLDQIPFPTITFCNSNVFKKSIAGSSDAMIEFLVLDTFTDPDVEHILKQVEKDKKVCKSNVTTKFSSMSLEDALTKVGVLNTLIELVGGYEDNVVKCWWDDIETACTNLFINHFTDIGWCFSYNPDKYFLGKGRMKNGTNQDEFSAMISKKSGPKSGAKLLLNIDQNEYCGKSANYDGAGYKIIIHDPLLQVPTYLSNPFIAPIYLRPGIEMTVTLQTVQFNRKTEHLSLCHSPQYPIRNGTKIYYKSLCFLLCHSLITFQRCSCFPNWIEGMESFVAVNLNMPLDIVKLCKTMEQFFCMHRNSMFDVIESLAFRCPFCTKDACVEKKFEHTISTSYFPSKSFGNTLSIDLAKNVSKIRKNFVLLNVLFEDMNMLNVIESQSIAFPDLVIYYGGITILFLGMSFMSFGEVLHQLFVLFHALGWMFYRYIFKRRERRIALHNFQQCSNVSKSVIKERKSNVIFVT